MWYIAAGSELADAVQHQINIIQENSVTGEFISKLFCVEKVETESITMGSASNDHKANAENEKESTGKLNFKMFKNSSNVLINSWKRSK